MEAFTLGKAALHRACSGESKTEKLHEYDVPTGLVPVGNEIDKLTRRQALLSHLSLSPASGGRKGKGGGLRRHILLAQKFDSPSGQAGWNP
ncbi:hypothetical protein CA13_55340 [Planctomycetes bacterium CA13]|uniref:Uncharacterized protein n=1 Tax=Novipirellula herctigrandis TaxID=2527986 RepID=A0A5C5ZA26_9BACT|nr:hypothetical protein CA13_55340 [Planctomycetes bacterium CA13]